MKKKLQTGWGSNRAWEQCYTWMMENRHRLKGYALLQADEETDVELLVDSVVTRVCEAVLAGRVGAEEAQLLPYTLRALRNMAETMRGRDWRGRAVESAYGRSLEGEEKGREAAAEAEQALQRAVLSLPQAEWEPVYLRIWQKKTYREMAEELQMAESTVRGHYAAALRHIKILMNEATDNDEH